MPEYRYPHFERQLLIEDMSFSGGPRPGEDMPDFQLTTSDGRSLRKQDLLGRPALLTFGSISCPMTAAAGDILQKLHRELGDDVDFITLYAARPIRATAIPKRGPSRRRSATPATTSSGIRSRGPWP